MCDSQERNGCLRWETRQPGEALKVARAQDTGHKSGVQAALCPSPGIWPSRFQGQPLCGNLALSQQFLLRGEEEDTGRGGWTGNLHTLSLLITSHC